jgi:hypothetical protein
MPGDLHPTLRRLDDLAASLASRGDVVAVLGLGSAGVETERFDDHSDIDFWLVVEDAAAKAGLLAGTAWLAGFGGTLAYSFVNDPNGRKALFEDGLFLEYAVFTPDELTRLAFTGARVAWQRPGSTLDLDDHLPPPAPTALDTVDFHVNEAITNLFVGLHRELRGERLTAMRFIQVYAVDRVLALLRIDDRVDWVLPDPFERTRRVERSGAGAPLAAMMPGYAANAAGAEAVLGWLESRYDTDVAITGPVRELIRSCG